MPTSPAKVLVADSPAAIEAFRRALATPLDLVTVTTMAQAWQALQDPPAVVVCGCHFDEDRMYDVLRSMKAAPALAQVPFVAIRILEGELEDTLYESVKIAVRALGGNAFVDYPRWCRKHGEAEASHRLTALVQRLAQDPHADTG